MTDTHTNRTSPAHSPHDVHVAIIGAGPAGLTASYLLTRAGAHVTVLESDPHLVGGISRTVAFTSSAADGNIFRFDIGGHRFFSKSHDLFLLEVYP